MNDTITILITGTGGIILAGVSYAVGHVRGRASGPNSYTQGYTQAKSDLTPAINGLKAKLARLTDRDEHGRYVRDDPADGVVHGIAYIRTHDAPLPTPALAAAPKHTRKADGIVAEGIEISSGNPHPVIKRVRKASN